MTRPIVGYAIICILSVSLIVPFIIHNSYAESETIQVDPGVTKYLLIYLGQGDTIQFSMSVSGGSGNDADLTIENPNFETISKLRVSQSYSNSLTSYASGNYKFSFGNTFSVVSSKQVQFSYNIIHPPSSSYDSSGGQAIGWIIFAAIVIIPIVVVISIVKRIKRRKAMPNKVIDHKAPEDPKVKEHNTKALDILKNRLAKGEIGKEEYDRLSKEFL